jgi:hypothetical protein
MQEGPLTMVAHGVLGAGIVYVVLRYGLKQSNVKSLNRSVLFGLLAAAYMIIFGHKLPY